MRISTTPWPLTLFKHELLFNLLGPQFSAQQVPDNLKDQSQTFGGQNSGNKNVGIFAQLAAVPAPKDSEQPV